MGSGAGAPMDDAMRSFQQRCSEAEDRLTRLEALAATKQDKPNNSSQDFSYIIKDLNLKIQNAKNELKTEKEKAFREIQKLEAENTKLQYRIKHLVRAVRDAEAEILVASNKGA